jgi:hypothetical protein
VSEENETDFFLNLTLTHASAAYLRKRRNLFMASKRNSANSKNQLFSVCQYIQHSTHFSLPFFLQHIVLLLSCAKANEVDNETENPPPEGYYAFIQSASAFPPTVRPPPYQPVSKDCPDHLNQKPYVSANNLCGDLNRGKIPRNPMGQNVMQEIYPL